MDIFLTFFRAPSFLQMLHFKAYYLPIIRPLNIDFEGNHSDLHRPSRCEISMNVFFFSKHHRLYMWTFHILCPSPIDPLDMNFLKIPFLRNIRPLNVASSLFKYELFIDIFRRIFKDNFFIYYPPSIWEFIQNIFFNFIRRLYVFFFFNIFLSTIRPNNVDF